MYKYTIVFSDDKPIKVELDQTLRMQNKIWFEGREYYVAEVKGSRIIAK